MSEKLQYEKSCGAVVYCHKDNSIKYLLVCEHGGFWVFPKGHMEDGESEHETALREIKEETGLSVTIIDGFQMEDEHNLAREGRPNTIKKTIYFLAKFEDQNPTRQESEISEIALLDFESAMAALQFDTYKQMLTKAHAFLTQKQEAITLFNRMHPGFFEQEHIQSMSEDWIFDEMMLKLDEFDKHRYEKTLDASVTFGFFEGNRAELLNAVEQVEPGWVQFFAGESRVFCGYLDGKVVSFCIVENMGTYSINGKTLKIGGPGCVGTLPEYRDKGIGLMMVKKATQILKDEGYDYSYIHYTYVAQWYEKLGYKTVLKWTKNGGCA